MTLHISSKVLDAIMAAAASAAPLECCGILLGRGDTITGALPTANVHPRPATHFEIDPAALISAYRDERGGGPAVAGFYHSHPNGVAIPSATDAAMAAHDGRIWAVIGAGNVRFWRDEGTGFKELSYALITG